MKTRRTTHIYFPALLIAFALPSCGHEHNEHSILLSLAIWVLGLIPISLVLIKRKKIPAIWLIGPLSFVFLLACLELGLRSGPFKYRFLPMEIGKNFESHPFLFWTPTRPQQPVEQRSEVADSDERNDSEIDFLQFRSGVVKIEKEPGTFRVMTMGGSNAEGAGIEFYKDILTGILETRLKKKYPEKKLEFIAAAVSGYALYQNLLFYKLYMREYRPDLVILYANINDAPNNTGPMTYRESFIDQTGIDISQLWIDVQKFPKKVISVSDFQNQFRRFRLYNALVMGLSKLRGDIIPKRLEKEVNSMEDYEKNMRDLIQIVQKDDAKLILADALCYRNHEPAPSLERYNRLVRMREIMKTYAEKSMGVYFIPIHDTLMQVDDPKTLIFYPEDIGHINKLGHWMAADLLFRKIVQWGLLEEKF